IILKNSNEADIGSMLMNKACRVDININNFFLFTLSTIAPPKKLTKNSAKKPNAYIAPMSKEEPVACKTSKGMARS
ncbi:hypothetical protein L3V64_000850, partial [Geobacillus stearothermophilus]|uniref:hypothetical protein n=1 Tax=Geobacillus stearothermophilus TaxID=1422 RepID=UPI002006351F